MKERRIYTVTLNPSLDRTLTTRYFNEGYHNVSEGKSALQPAGAGLSISRALHSLGINTHALVLLGSDETGNAYQTLIVEDPTPSTTVRVDGRTRSNTIIYDVGQELETQITEESADIEWHDIQLLQNLLTSNLVEGDVVVLAGPLPQGAPEDSYARLIETARKLGAEVALATSSDALKAALPLHPDWVALRRMEFEALVNHPLRVVQDVVHVSRELIGGSGMNLLVEFEGEHRALLVSAEEEWMVEIPLPEEGTSSGAWSALIAGVIAGQTNQLSVDEALELGAAAAWYAASHVGYKFGEMDEVEVLSEQIEVEPVKDEGVD